MVVVYATDVAVGNNMKQTRMRAFLTDPATEIRLITYLWMFELSPMVRPHNVKMKFTYAHGSLNPGEYESEQDVNWNARGAQSMKLSDIGVQFGDFDLCAMYFKLSYMVGPREVPYPMMTDDRYSDPELHVTTMLYRTQAQFAKHLTMQQNMVSFQHLDMIITYIQVEPIFIRTVDECNIEMCRSEGQVNWLKTIQNLADVARREL